MKIVGVAACTSGIAHTYIAKEKLMAAARELGHEITVETQGTIGTEDELSEKAIREADIVIIAADIKISGKSRFDGKRLIEIPTHIAIKSPKALIHKISQDLSLE